MREFPPSDTFPPSDRFALSDGFPPSEDGGKKQETEFDRLRSNSSNRGCRPLCAPSIEFFIQGEYPRLSSLPPSAYSPLSARPGASRKVKSPLCQPSLEMARGNWRSEDESNWKSEAKSSGVWRMATKGEVE